MDIPPWELQLFAVTHQKYRYGFLNIPSDPSRIWDLLWCISSSHHLEYWTRLPSPGYIHSRRVVYLNLCIQEPSGVHTHRSWGNVHLDISHQCSLSDFHPDETGYLYEPDILAFLTVLRSDEMNILRGCNHEIMMDYEIFVLVFVPVFLRKIFSNLYTYFLA